MESLALDAPGRRLFLSDTKTRRILTVDLNSPESAAENAVALSEDDRPRALAYDKCTS